MDIVHLYTDGSSIDGQYGGYCAVNASTGEIFAGRACLTNQQAELMAIELAMRQVPDGATAYVYTDSAFAIGCLARGFNLSNSPWLKDVVSRIQDDWVRRHVHGKFLKVKGHSDDKINMLCDKLAKEQAYLCKYEYKR